MITKEQANLLADLARTIRPAWDTRGVVAAIEKLWDRDLADLTFALIRTAEDTAIRTPGGLGIDSQHWRPTVVESTEQRHARIQAQKDETEEADADRAYVSTLARDAARAKAKAALAAGIARQQHLHPDPPDAA